MSERPIASSEIQLLTPSGRVLGIILRSPGITQRKIAIETGLTERRVIWIINDFESAGLIVRERKGRRAFYTIVSDSVREHYEKQFAPYLGFFKP